MLNECKLEVIFFWIMRSHEKQMCWHRSNAASLIFHFRLEKKNKKRKLHIIELNYMLNIFIAILHVKDKSTNQLFGKSLLNHLLILIHTEYLQHNLPTFLYIPVHLHLYMYMNCEKRAHSFRNLTSICVLHSAQSTHSSIAT